MQFPLLITQRCVCVDSNNVITELNMNYPHTIINGISADLKGGRIVQAKFQIVQVVVELYIYIYIYTYIYILLLQPLSTAAEQFHHLLHAALKNKHMHLKTMYVETSELQWNIS